MKIRNMVKDLSEDQLKIVLEAEPGHKARGYEGKTLGEFVDEEMYGCSSLTDLYQEMCAWNLKWPFRLVHVDVEATVSRRFTLAVLEDATMKELNKWSSSEIAQLDPDFSLEGAFCETFAAAESGDICYDYAIEDDLGRKILDWDDKQ